MAVATQHGRFVQRRGEQLRFDPAEPDGDARLSITMMSRAGLLPEADFYCPIPYEPLKVMTPAALAGLEGSDHLLDAAFDLFRAELELADPGYAAALDLTNATVDDFAARYFRARKQSEPFVWARRNLADLPGVEVLHADTGTWLGDTEAPSTRRRRRPARRVR